MSTTVNVPDLFPYKPSSQKVIDTLAPFVGTCECILRRSLIDYVDEGYHARLLSPGTGDGIMGNVVQRFSGLPFSDNSPSSDCSDAEQKISRLKDDFSPKETIALSMIHPEKEFMGGGTFETSPMWTKSRRLLICPIGSTGILLAPYIIDLADVRHVIEPDWNTVEEYFLENGKMPSSRVGTIIQGRTKGQGETGVPKEQRMIDKPRAWYLKAPFLSATLVRSQERIDEETFNSLVLNTSAMKNLGVLRKELKSHLTTQASSPISSSQHPRCAVSH